MEVIAVFLLGAVMFMHAWQIFGFSHPKTTGLVGAVGALGIASLMVFKPLDIWTVGLPPAALAASLVTWAIYCALVAATGLWDFDLRGFGFYSIWAALGMVGQIVYTGGAGQYILKGIIEGIVLAIAFGILFFYWGVPYPRLRQATAWVLLVASIVITLLGVLVLFKVPGLI